MAELPLIPTPPAQRWREFRIQNLPVLVFATAFLCAFYLWRESVTPATLVGEVETIRADVTSPDSGLLTNLWVTRFQPVKAGDVVAEVMATDSPAFDSSVQLLRGKIALSQLEVGSLLDRERLAFDYQMLRLDYLRQRVELATARAQLGPADHEYKAAGDLLNAKLLSEVDYDYFAKIREPLKAKVDETGKLVDELEKRLEQAKHLLEFFPSDQANTNWQRALAAIEQNRAQLARLGTEPVLLKAPIDGVVSAIYRRAGENILAGEPIITISALQGERIVGYLRQPFPIEPQVGMPVQIRLRSMKRQELLSQILAVGKQFEPITNSLAMLRPGLLVDMGLPISVALPAAVKLLPGELVDMSIRPRAR
ncbi:MAG: hypothetical protein AAB676_03845 [Verrucomicrobiota bacterium]